MWHKLGANSSFLLSRVVHDDLAPSGNLAAADATESSYSGSGALVLLYYVDPEDPVSDAEGVRFRAACTNEYSKWRGSVSP